MGQSRGEAGRSTVPNSRNRPAGSGVPAPYASFIAWLRSLTSTVPSRLGKGLGLVPQGQLPRSPGAALKACGAAAASSRLRKAASPLISTAVTAPAPRTGI
jgi:hypothetical protein